MRQVINNEEIEVLKKVLNHVFSCLEPEESLNGYISNEGLLILLDKVEYEHLVTAMQKLNRND